MPRNFNPWKGSSYPISPNSLLILGESHHNADGEGAWFTQATVECYIRDESGEGGNKRWHAFFTTVQHLVQGNERSWIPPEARAEFWNEVLFYNYIQQSIGDGGHGPRPTFAMWQEAASPFLEMLDEFRPLRILACGRGLWQHVRQLGHSVNVVDGAVIFSAGAHDAIGIGIVHPSGGMSYATERPRVKALLRATVQ